MKINDVSRMAQMQSYQKAARQQNAQGAGAYRTASDGVSISPEALQMARELHGEEMSPERADRIASVKQAIQNGTYQVEPDAVVRKMLAAYGEG
ncbi:MAG: flagellar biosynthesis anti-sigma factor FlgM [Tumebacillaceae bacterium]